MHDNSFSELNWPKWQWQLNRWSGGLSLLLGVVAYFAPFTGASQQNLLIAIGIGIMSILFIAPIVLYIAALYNTIRARVVKYPKLYNHNQEQLRSLQATNKFLGEAIPLFIKFTILRVLFQQERKLLYIVIQRVEEIRLEEGDGIYVIDDDYTILGEFKVSQVRPRDYFAVGVNVSPTWIGYVRQEGKSEMLPPPDAFATLIPRRP